MARSTSGESITRTIAGHEVTISNPGKVLFPKPKYTKLDLVEYYVAVADGAPRGAGGRPNMLVRFPNGAGAELVHQKRPLGPPGRRSRTARCGLARLARQSRLPRAASSSGARRRSRSPR